MEFLPQKPIKNAATGQDPFAYFELPLPQTKKSLYRSSWLRLPSLSFRQCLPLARMYRWPLGILTVLTLGWWGLSLRHESKPPFAYVEIRAIDPNGHPIAGAKVELGSLARGITDSFGEWRRYVRLQPGSTVSLRVIKALPRGEWMAQKKMMIPEKHPLDKELELKTSVQLFPDGVAPAKPVAVAKPQPATSDQAPKAAEQPLAAAAPGPRFDFTRLAISIKPSPRAQVGLLRQLQSDLEKDVMPALRNRLTDLGIVIDSQSPWRMQLQLVPLTDQTAAVKVILKAPSLRGEEFAVFMRGMQPKVVDTVSQIVNHVRVHTPKTFALKKENNNWFISSESQNSRLFALEGGEVLRDSLGQQFPVAKEMFGDNEYRLRLVTAGEVPCGKFLAADAVCVVQWPTVQTTPPVQGWRLLQMKILGDLPAGAQVMVSGFAARRVAPTIWEYWGEALTGANLTIVEEDRVLLRMRIQDKDQELPVVRYQSRNKNVAKR